MKNPDLTTIGSIIISVVLLIMTTVLLLYGIITFTSAGYILAGVFALNGFSGALKAPSAQQAEQLIGALANSAPVAHVPLVTITHNAPMEAQVSSTALPGQTRIEPQPTVLRPMETQGLVSVPPGQGTFTTPIMPPVLAQQPPSQDWRQWTNMTQVPPTQQ